VYAGVHGQRVAVEHDEIRVLADLQAAHAVREVEHLRSRQCHGFEGLLATHATAHGKRRAAQEQATVGDEVVRVDRNEHPRLREHRARVVGEARGFQFSTGGIDQDDRARHIRLRDLVRDPPAFADVVQDDTQSELLGEAQHRHDVVRAVCVVVHDAGPGERFHEHLEPEVARGALRCVVARGRDLVAVRDRVQEALAHEGRALCAGARERAGAALRIGAIGHLQSAVEGSIRPAVGEVLDGFAFAQLEVHRLAADEMTRAGHRIDRRESARPRAVHTRRGGIDGIDARDLGLDRTRAVGAPGLANMAVGADQTRHEHLAGDIDHFRVAGHLHGIQRSNRADLSVCHHQNTPFDGGPSDGQDARAYERADCGRGCGGLLRRKRQAEREAGEQEGDRHAGDPTRAAPRR